MLMQNSHVQRDDQKTGERIIKQTLTQAQAIDGYKINSSEMDVCRCQYCMYVAVQLRNLYK